MALDKEQEIRLEHKLELRRLLIDRIGIGLLIVVAAFLSNWLLENIKRNATQENFVLEKKLEAVSMTQSAHSKITTYLYTAIGLECRQPSTKVISIDDFQEYQKLDSGFRSTVNSRIYLLSQDYQSATNRAHNLIAGIASIVKNTKDPDCSLRVFLNDITKRLEYVTRKEFGLDEPNEAVGFLPIEKSPAEIEALTLDGYFQMNFDAWKADKGVGSS